MKRNLRDRLTAPAWAVALATAKASEHGWDARRLQP